MAHSMSSSIITLISAALLLIAMVESADPPPTKTTSMQEPKFQEFSQASAALQKQLVLNYDEGCKYEDGQKLRAFTKKVLEFASTNQMNDKLEELTKDLKELSKSQYCNTLKALECKENNNKCGCLSLSDSGIEIHAEVEGDVCRLKKGSPCFAGAAGHASQFVCKSGTSCLLQSDKKSECKNPPGVKDISEVVACECV